MDKNLVQAMLRAIGEDPSREGLQETPLRVTKAWSFWTRGYDQNPADVLKTFEDGSEGYDGAVFQENIPFYSHCEHHLAPFFGVAHIGYIPNGKVVGLSKLKRVTDIFAQRLQVQERLTKEIAEALWVHLKPLGVGVTLQARHLCMESRGICVAGTRTTTTSLRGAYLEDASLKAEFNAQVANAQKRDVP